MPETTLELLRLLAEGTSTTEIDAGQSPTRATSALHVHVNTVAERSSGSRGSSGTTRPSPPRRSSCISRCRCAGSRSV